MSERKRQIREAFRQIVFKRDGFKCRVCGWNINLSQLDAHHITNRNEMPNGGYVKENGISLCPDCHYEAERHLTDPQQKGLKSEYHPVKLYQLIKSSKDQAIKASYLL